MIALLFDVTYDRNRDVSRLLTILPYQNDSTCTDIVLCDLGYEPDYGGNDIIVSWDQRSVMVGICVVNQRISVADLTAVTSGRNFILQSKQV
jgi:hypothetical protein